MADETDPDRDVLRSLPRTRPARRSDKRPTRSAAAAPAKAKAKAEAKPKDAPPPRRKVPPAGYAPPNAEPDQAKGATSPTEIVATAVQAGVELTQIGFTVSRQALKSVLDRVPKP